MMLLASNQAHKLTRRDHDLIQINAKLNPEVSDIMAFADDKDYITSQKATLYDQDFHDTEKYSMTPDQYESLMQKEQEREMRDKEDKQAHENLQKLEQDIDNQRYQ